MSRWSIETTREKVEALFGRAHLDLVAPSLISLPERLTYARYHFKECEQLLSHFAQLHLAEKPLPIVIYGANEASRKDFNVLMIQVGAHATACVLSIHSIPDLVAHAAYHALGHSLNHDSLRERDISAASVKNRLNQFPAHAQIADALTKLCNNSSFRHIAALANKSKHQSLVRPILNEDFTGSRSERHELRFSAFRYDGKDFPESTLTSVLEPAYNLASQTVIEVGNMINDILAQDES